MQQFHTHTYNTQSQRQPFCNTAAQKRISRHLVNAPIRLPFGPPLWLCTKPSGGEGQVFSDCSAASCASLTAPSSSGKRSGWRPGRERGRGKRAAPLVHSCALAPPLCVCRDLYLTLPYIYGLREKNGTVGLFRSGSIPRRRWQRGKFLSLCKVQVLPVNSEALRQ